MSKYSIAVCVLLCSVLISSVSQILLKTAANKNYKTKIAEYLNFRVIAAYGMFFLSTILTMLALKYVPLSMSPILESSSYIFVSVMGYFLLKRTLYQKKTHRPGPDLSGDYGVFFVMDGRKSEAFCGVTCKVRLLLRFSSANLRSH